MDQEYLDFVKTDCGATIAEEVKKEGGLCPQLQPHVLLARVLMRHSTPSGPPPVCTSRNIRPTFRRECRQY
jgi:hypothetical protein